MVTTCNARTFEIFCSRRWKGIEKLDVKIYFPMSEELKAFKETLQQWIYTAEIYEEPGLHFNFNFIVLFQGFLSRHTVLINFGLWSNIFPGKGILLLLLFGNYLLSSHLNLPSRLVDTCKLVRLNNFNFSFLLICTHNSWNLKILYRRPIKISKYFLHISSKVPLIYGKTIS